MIALLARDLEIEYLSAFQHLNADEQTKITSFTPLGPFEPVLAVLKYLLQAVRFLTTFCLLRDLALRDYESFTLFRFLLYWAAGVYIGVVAHVSIPIYLIRVNKQPCFSL